MLPTTPSYTHLAFKYVDEQLTEILRREYSEQGKALVLVRHELHMLYLDYCSEETFTLTPNILADQNTIVLRSGDDFEYVKITIDPPGKHILPSEIGDLLRNDTCCSNVAETNIRACWTYILQLAYHLQVTGIRQHRAVDNPDGGVSVSFRSTMCDVIITIHPDVMAHKRG